MKGSEEKAVSKKDLCDPDEASDSVFHAQWKPKASHVVDSASDAGKGALGSAVTLKPDEEESCLTSPRDQSQGTTDRGLWTRAFKQHQHKMWLLLGEQ